MLPIVGAPDMPPPGAPGPFAFADADRVAGILEGAGFTDVAVDAATQPLLLGGGLDLDEAVAWLSEGGMGKRFLAGADAATADRALARRAGRHGALRHARRRPHGFGHLAGARHRLISGLLRFEGVETPCSRRRYQ